MLVDLRPDPLATFARQHRLAWRIQWDVGREVVQAARRHSVPPAVALQRSWSESRLLPGLIGAAGERGALQVHPAFFPEVLRQSPAERIDTGIRILAQNHAACGSWERAVRRYRTGRC